MLSRLVVLLVCLVASVAPLSVPHNIHRGVAHRAVAHRAAQVQPTPLRRRTDGKRCKARASSIASSLASIHSTALVHEVSTSVPPPAMTTTPKVEPTTTKAESTTPKAEPTSKVESTTPKAEPTSKVESTTPKAEPTTKAESTTPKAEPTIIKAESTTTPKVEPTTTSKAEPTTTPKAEPTTTPKAEPTTTPKAEPTTTPKAEPTTTPKAEPTTSKAPAPTQAPASNTPSFLVGTQTGQGTFYSTGLGACGITNADSDFIAAVSEHLFDVFPGYNGVNPNTNPICGKQVTASYEGKSVVVTITDRCTACALTDLDFSPSAFSQLAAFSVGRISGMTWKWN